MHLAVRTLIHEHVLWKTSFMTSGLAERKERIFGTRRTPNTITVPINWRRDWGAGQDRKELVLVVSAALPILVFLVPSILRRLWEGPTKPDTLHTQHRRNQELTFPGPAFHSPFHAKISWSFVLAEPSFAKVLPSEKWQESAFPTFASGFVKCAVFLFCFFYLQRSQQAIKDACPHFDGGVLKSEKTILTIAMGLHFTIFKY